MMRLQVVAIGFAVVMGCSEQTAGGLSPVSNPEQDIGDSTSRKETDAEEPDRILFGRTGYPPPVNHRKFGGGIGSGGDMHTRVNPCPPTPV